MSLITSVMNFLAIGNRRSIQNITGYITLTESTTDALEITNHPVQQGAAITDHAFVKPCTFTAQIQFNEAGITDSISNALQGAVFGQNTVSQSNGSVQETYQKLLDLQATREPFSVMTPKRTYANMLFQSLSVTTDRKSETILAVTAIFQQIVIVNVTTTVIPRTKLKNPGKNGGTQNSGKKSALLTAATGIVPGQRGFTSGLSQ